MKNQTLVSEIVLLGFQNLHNFKIPLFSLFLLIYIMIICENVLIIVLVSSSRNLQSPMYFFLQQLSVCDFLESTIIVPILLQTVKNEGATMYFVDCLVQFYFFSLTEAFECFLLVVMSYDRYVAICIPLHYTSIMSHRVCVTLIFVSWLLSLIGIVSNTGRQKAFSTCSSHLAVVSIFYGALIAIYVVPPRKELQTISKVLSLLYTVVTPLVNPLIYSLRSKDIRDVLQRILNRLHQAPRGQIY
ncbi:hypothetical protein XELAEV_18019604mg [Xenopus laevis]|uniref:G-protein coupled receptors family 1 profile domain-containing protein n=1 Tax=Xenopus laevis TaxID=8355 RepID=A0A974DGG2_XENLA|nr:hypothetical protein XELAEV_18019604mg [Xenopus laevis]